MLKRKKTSELGSESDDGMNEEINRLAEANSALTQALVEANATIHTLRSHLEGLTSIVEEKNKKIVDLRASRLETANVAARRDQGCCGCCQEFGGTPK